MKKEIVIHPFIFAVYPIIFLLSNNIEELFISKALLPITITIGFTFLSVLLFKLLPIDNKKAGIIISWFWILFFSYGHIFKLLEGSQIVNFINIRPRYVLLIWCILLISIIYLVIKTRRQLTNFTKILNIVALVLALVQLVNIGYYKLIISDPKEIESRQIVEAKYNNLGADSTLPDIYWIILDGYARADILDEYYEFNNQYFLDSLKSKGFYIASESHSNYATTFLSLSSTLDMNYVNYISDIVEVGSKDRSIPYSLMENNKVLNFLKTQDYKIINFDSGWGPTSDLKHSDIQFKFSILDEFLEVLIQTTILGPFRKFLEIDKRSRLSYTFTNLTDLYKIEGPKFTLAHIMCPHPPYVFGKDGEAISGADIEFTGDEVWLQKENYINQLIFLNKKMNLVIEEILSNSYEPPIIILQSDHGSESSFGQYPNYGWNNPNNIMLKERMSILNAYYLPGGGDKLLYDSITPINTFKIILNFYFNTNLELLKDEIYFSSYDRPYEFISVNDKLK